MRQAADRAASATFAPVFEKAGSVRVLEVDPDLGRGLEADRFGEARRDLVAASGTIDAGDWEPLRDLEPEDRHLGLLVVDGLMLRDIAVASTTCAELVGEGDVLRPWEHFGDQAPMPYEISWHVLEPTRIAVLDRRPADGTDPRGGLVTAGHAAGQARAR
jgi:CRP/FNR family transcriptional regulator, cyclic AMP receptor protein